MAPTTEESVPTDRSSGKPLPLTSNSFLHNTIITHPVRVAPHSSRVLDVHHVNPYVLTTRLTSLRIQQRPQGERLRQRKVAEVQALPITPNYVQRVSPSWFRRRIVRVGSRVVNSVVRV